jgi:hypothetical protein
LRGDRAVSRQTELLLEQLERAVSGAAGAAFAAAQEVTAQRK